MSTQLIRLADSLALLSARLRAEAQSDDGTLSVKFGGAISELMQLRDVVTARIGANDTRLDQLQRVDATLAELAATFAALPKPRSAEESSSRPVQRRRKLRAARLDASTRRLLRRAALVLGISGASAAVGIPFAAATVCAANVCTGSFADGITFGAGIITATVKDLTANIMPASGISGIALTGGGTEGTHHGAGDSGTGGGTGPALALTVSDTTHTIVVTGDNAQGIFVQSQGGGGGNGGDGVGEFQSGGNGGAGGTGGAVGIDNSIAIVTADNYSSGIRGVSRGGDGGVGGDNTTGPPGSGGPGGNGGTVTITNHGAIQTAGTASFGIFGQSIGGNGGRGGNATLSVESGGTGGGAYAGGVVTIDNDGGIVTTGDGAHGIYGASVGGFAGNGGSAIGLFGYGGDGSPGGPGGDVHVTNAGMIQTSGAGAFGILAQSVGGGGGNGGTGAGLVGIGGAGSNTSPGGNVSVANSGAITTTGLASHAIEAQSVGGGGGDGGLGVGIITIGGSGGAGGDSGTVNVSNTGALSTIGADATAIFAQSIGGGGGDGGNAAALGAFLSLALGGGGGLGGDGNTVTVSSDTGAIITTGDRADGIFAQSIGGGGGNGGYAISASAGPDFSISVGIGGQGSDGGKAAAVGVGNGSDITTSGPNAYGIFAQSIGGGGGNGGMAIAAAASDGVSGTFAIGGHAGGGGNGDAVTLTNSGVISTGGVQSDGILAQSIGGGGATAASRSAARRASSARWVFPSAAMAAMAAPVPL